MISRTQTELTCRIKECMRYVKNLEVVRGCQPGKLLERGCSKNKY